MFGFSSRVVLIASSFLATGVRIGAGFILLRFLSPSDYGKFTIVMASSGFVLSLGDFGIYRVVTTRQDLPTGEVLETATLVTIALYALYALVGIMAGGFYAWQYDEAKLLWIGAITAATTAASGYYNLQTAALARDLNFARWARLELLLVVVTAASSVALAVAGSGIYALALPPLFAQLATALAVPRSAGVTWPRRLNRPMLRSFLGFGWQNATFQYLYSLPAHVISLMVGGINAPTVLGREERTEQVGVLSRALSIKSIFGYNPVMAIDKVVFPLMCRDQDKPARFADLVVRGCVYMFSLLGFGAMACIATAPDLVRVMCGLAWLPIIPILQIIVIELFFIGFSVLGIWTVMVYRRPLAATRFGFVQLVLLLPSGLVYHYFGMVAFCAAITLSTAASSTWFGLTTVRRYGVSLRRLVGRLLPVAVALMVAGVAMAVLRLQLISMSEMPETWWPSFVRLSACGAIGLIFAAAVMWLIDSESLREIRALFGPSDAWLNMSTISPARLSIHAAGQGLPIRNLIRLPYTRLGT